MRKKLPSAAEAAFLYSRELPAGGAETQKVVATLGRGPLHAMASLR